MRVRSPNDAAVDVHSAVDFATAMQSLVKGWTEYKNVVTVDPQAGCVSYQQNNCCIIFSINNAPRVQFVEADGLPPSFIGAEQAQQVCLDAQEM